MTESTNPPTRGAIDEILRSVLDPCSCVTSNPTSIVDLGLVEDVAIDGDDVAVELVLTSPSCAYFPHIRSEIVEKVRACDDVTVDEVAVTQNTRTVWSRERMSAAERERRNERFERRVEDEGLTPKWSESERAPSENPSSVEPE